MAIDPGLQPQQQPPTPGQPPPPAAPPPVERRRYERRAADRNQMLRTGAAAALSICGGLAFLYLFFALLGAVDVGDAIAATIAAIVLALVWFGGFLYRHLTQASLSQRSDRERRGF